MGALQSVDARTGELLNKPWPESTDHDIEACAASTEPFTTSVGNSAWTIFFVPSLYKMRQTGSWHANRMLA